MVTHESQKVRDDTSNSRGFDRKSAWSIPLVTTIDDLADFFDACLEKLLDWAHGAWRFVLLSLVLIFIPFFTQLRHTVTHSLSHTRTTLSHTHTPLSQTLFTNDFITHSLSHTPLSHTFSQTSLTHTHYLSHTTLSHPTLSHTLFHTQLCHTQSCHTQSCHTPPRFCLAGVVGVALMALCSVWWCAWSPFVAHDPATCFSGMWVS